MEINITQAIDQAPFNRGLTGADWLSTPGNVPVVLGNGDIALFDNEGDGIYEMHVLFRSRGKEAIASARKALKIIFTRHRASLIFAMVPDCRRDVKLLARWAGLKSRGLRYTVHGFCELFVISNISWKGLQS